MCTVNCKRAMFFFEYHIEIYTENYSTKTSERPLSKLDQIHALIFIFKPIYVKLFEKIL